MSKNKINIAVIDDGINEKYFKNIGKLVHNIEVSPDCNIKQRSGYDAYSISHGTICGSIIKKGSPDTYLSSIKILDSKTKVSNKNQLIKAIKWCIHNGIDLINLSLGSSCFEDYKLLKDIVGELYINDVVIVAAMNNKDIITYPASFGNVIGVKTCKTEKLGEFEYLFMDTPLDGIEIHACSSYMLRDCKGEIYVSNLSNSYAAPAITSKVANLMEDCGKLGLDEIRWNLALESKNKDKRIFTYFHRSLEWVENTIAFCINYNWLPLEKVKNCSINIQKIVDINTDKIENVFERINDYLKNEEYILDGIGTIILIFDFGLNYTENDIESLCKQLGYLKKNIVLLPIEYKALSLDIPFAEYNGRLVYPREWNRYSVIESNTYCDNVPIIGVFSLCVDMNLEIISQISNLLKNDGFNCIVSSTESIGLLYGFSFIPLTDDGVREESLKRYYDSLINFYEANVLIASISTKEISECACKASCFNFDLKVFLVDKIGNELLKIVDEKSIIFVINGNSAPCGLPKNKVFFLNSQGVFGLYKYITNFFND